MRLRQAVLHPSLVLKRLKENLRAKGVNRTAIEDDPVAQAGELEETAIQRLIERYTAGLASEDLAEGTQDAIDEMLEVKDEGGADEAEAECMLCMEVRRPLPSDGGPC